MNPALVQALRQVPAPVRAIDDVAAWWAVWRSLDDAGGGSAGWAIASGLAADRVGWAFAGGYQAALRALCPALPHDTLAALCVTEDAGNRPRDIRTTLSPQADGSWRVDGAKRWTTLGPASSLLLVVGTLPPSEADTRPVLRVVRVPVPAPGLVLNPMPETRFVPEVPHAQVALHGVAVPADALLPGDGYDEYVKPFRTIEDVHVTLAVLAYLLREARARSWVQAFAEETVAALEGLCTLVTEDPLAPTTHVALAGALRQAQRLYTESAPLWAAAGDDTAAAHWRRDAALLQVAAAARAQRAVTAWARLAGPPPARA